MKLIVGLGNPGGEYSDTYHNVGFIALDLLASRFRAPDFAYDKKSDSDLTDISAGGEKILLCKPRTYMNLSGNAVAFLSRYYKIEHKDILVIYDDIDIKKGIVRARLSGSAGTHNGMRDIVAKLGGVGFARIRIGTGLKPCYMQLADYVLAHFGSAEKPLLEKSFAAACDFAEAWARGEAWQDLTVAVTAE